LCYIVPKAGLDLEYDSKNHLGAFITHEPKFCATRECRQSKENKGWRGNFWSREESSNAFGITLLGKIIVKLNL
jgi:hypothetical protein